MIHDKPTPEQLKSTADKLYDLRARLIDYWELLETETAASGPEFKHLDAALTAIAQAETALLELAQIRPALDQMKPLEQ
jgi:hypothetical protein